MLQYLWGLIASVWGADGGREWAAVKLSITTVLATWWAAASVQVQGFAVSLPVIWVTIFWALDWVLGSLLAWRDHRYDPRRGLFSVVKWLVWMAALLVCWGLRQDGHLLDDWIPPLLEVAIILTEGASVLRNGAKLLASLSGREAGGILDRFADAADRAVKRKLNELEQQTEGPDEGPSPVPGGAP